MKATISYIFWGIVAVAVVALSVWVVCSGFGFEGPGPSLHGTARVVAWCGLVVLNVLSFVVFAFIPGLFAVFFAWALSYGSSEPSSTGGPGQPPS